MVAGNAALVGAVISASVAVLVAVGTQIWTSLRARTDRQYVARRAGLVEAQDAMLELRDALAEYGTGIRPSHDQSDLAVARPEPTARSKPHQELEARKRAATGRFQTCAARVHDDAVAFAMWTWQSAAERSFISVEEVSAHVEDEWFAHVQALCRAALMSSTGITSSRDRAGLQVPTPLIGD